ncbi:unnamed protein product [Arctogadus glacialis]
MATIQLRGLVIAGRCGSRLECGTLVDAVLGGSAGRCGTLVTRCGTLSRRIKESPGSAVRTPSPPPDIEVKVKPDPIRPLTSAPPQDGACSMEAGGRLAQH